MLHGKRRIEVMLVVFDVLVIDGRPVSRRQYWERRRMLEDLALESDHWSTTPVYDDGEAPGRRSLTSAWKASLRRNAAATTARPTRLDQDQ